jgi:hypothetical protein
LAAAVAMVAAPLAITLSNGPAHAAAAINPRLVWQKPIAAVRESSPTVANLDGQNDIVVGTLGSNVTALHGSDGSGVGGFPAGTEGHPIASSPSVADTDGDGKPEIFIGAGTADAGQNHGGLYSFGAAGNTRWVFHPTDADTGQLAVHSSPALGDVNNDGTADVTAGALGLQMWSVNQGGGANGGWPFYTDDTVFSSPALADVNGDGQTDIIIGGDATPGGPVDHQGGIMRAISGNGQLLWSFFTDEQLRSSPSVGDIDGDGKPEIVFGTGNYWALHGGASDSTKVFVLNMNGTLKWSIDLGGYTVGSPALADVNGDGRLDIVEGTLGSPGNTNGGRVFAIDGMSHAAMAGWPVQVPGGVVIGSITTADFNNDGAQDVLVPTGAGMYAYDGKTAASLFDLAIGSGFGFQNSAWIGDIDGNGSLDIVIAGATPNEQNGEVFRYELPSTAKLGSNNWSQFRKDPRLTGSWTNPPLIHSLCPPPGGGGYWLVASDGGIFAYCDAHFFGSTGGIHINQPVVGMAGAPNGSGYWLVASDGGIFNYGTAGFFGSTGGTHLNQPVVGMARTPSGNGYWLVASDGGVFNYGDAGFYGSTGGIHLNSPVVGIASTADGKGYWLVAADGGIFNYGDAGFFGSAGGAPLNKPVVGMAAAPNGSGYWLVATDGGIFNYGSAGFFGSTGSVKLNKPVVGMSRSASGHGYWLVASDGGIFNYGDSGFFGSTGGIHLNQPVVGMAAPGV